MERCWYACWSVPMLLWIIALGGLVSACSVDVNGYRAKGGSTGQVKCAGACG